MGKLVEQADAERAPDSNDSPLALSVERFAQANSYADIGWGDPGDSDGWFHYNALCDQPFGDRVLDRIAREYQTTVLVSGTYAFRAANYLPLGLAGFLFAAERRVPRLCGNIALRDRGYLNGFRLLEPRAIVLESDPLAGMPGFETVPNVAALADALFDEVSRTAEPLIEAWASRKLLAPANAWGILLDFLAYGFLAAGSAGLGPDAAWAAWSQAIAGRTFPIRRRPRRLQFEVDGTPEEVMVRAHCCLYYTLPQAEEAEHRYCVSCYLETDECRIQRQTAVHRANAAKGR